MMLNDTIISSSSVETFKLNIWKEQYGTEITAALVWPGKDNKEEWVDNKTGIRKHEKEGTLKSIYK